MLSTKRLHINHMRLRDKLLLMYAVAVFIPIVLTNVIFYSVTSSNIKSQKIHDAKIQIDKLKREFQAAVDETVGISYIFYADFSLNEALDREYPSSIDYVEAYTQSLRTFISRYTQSSQARWLEIYVENPTVLPSGNIQRITSDVRAAGWFKEITASKVPYPIIVMLGPNLSLAQRLDNYPSSNHTGLKVLKIDFNMDEIRSIFRNSGFDGKLYLVSPDGMVRFSNEPIANSAHGVSFSAIKQSKSTISLHQEYTNSNYLNGWRIEGVLNENIVLQEVRKSRSFVIYLACLNFVIPTLFLLTMSRSIHVRLIRILKHMKKVKNHSFETIPTEGFRDEIGQLTEEFNRMTERIQSLIDDVYIADIQKKNLELKQQEAQLHALHSQINPHFLFNVLETIRMRSLIKGELETARIIQNMAKIFRKSISWGRNWVTVREEIELISCFLEIQKYRFGDKLEYILDVDPAAMDCLIPKMTLIPFVENASMHGVESSPGKGVIRLSVDLRNGYLEVSVSDNGVGIPEEKLIEINEYLNDTEAMGERVGMKNAYFRLKMCYKDRFSFRIKSTQGEGTSVQIRLPGDASNSG